MTENTNLSLQLLLLNDLLHNKIIDKNIYDEAVQKLRNIKKKKQAA